MYWLNKKNQNNGISIPKIFLKVYGYDFTQWDKSHRKIWHASENNALFMTKNVNFAYLPWTVWGTLKKQKDIIGRKNGKGKKKTFEYNETCLKKINTVPIW